MYNYFVAFYNYILSFFYPLSSPVAPVPSDSDDGTWEDVYESIDSQLNDFAEKLDGLDKLFYSSSNETLDKQSNPLEKMFDDISLDFRSIQKMVLRLKNMPVTDDSQRLIRDQNVKDIAKYLQQESTTFRQLQNLHLMKSEQDNKDDLALKTIDQNNVKQVVDQINEVKQEMMRREELIAKQKETQLEQFNYSL